MSSCSAPEKYRIPNQGKIRISNGKDEQDSISYICKGCDTLISDTSFFYKVVQQASKLSKDGLRYPLSYLPKNITIQISSLDSIYHYKTNERIDSILQAEVKIDYIAKNGYGNELEGTNTEYITFKGNEIQNIDSIVKHPDLTVTDKGYITPSLSSIGVGNSGWIDILPSSSKDLIITTSISCVSSNANLYIHLDNGELISKSCWNEFNCEGTAYSKKFNDSEIKMLKSHFCNGVSFSDGQTIITNIYPNRQDYFIQLMKLWYPEK